MGNFYILCSIILPIIGHAVSDKIHSLELKMVDSTLVTMLKQNIHPREIDEMIRNLTANKIIPVPLIRYLDSDFYGEVLFGHPGQKMRMAFDTSWTDSWVPTTTCSALSPACKTRNKYDPQRSPFSVRTKDRFEVPFGNESLKGIIYQDLVHINQVNVTKQLFAAVSEIPYVFVYSNFDGILGLSLEPNTQIPTVIYGLLRERKITRKVFSFYFNRNPASKKGGTLAFGGVQPRHYKGNFTYAKLIKQDGEYKNWMFRIDKINITTPAKVSTILCKEGCNAIASTGNNPITGPTAITDEINRDIGAQKYFQGRYSVDCETVRNLPKVKFTIGGKDFVLSGKDYIQKIQVNGTFSVCLSAYKENDDADDQTIYIGGAFMSKYYTTFDMEAFRIGFADANI